MVELSEEKLRWHEVISIAWNRRELYWRTKKSGSLDLDSSLSFRFLHGFVLPDRFQLQLPTLAAPIPKFP